MSVKKLSDEIQSIISSSSNISNYKRTVEELVYNSLDAKSTSIAIRIHIQENKIQVVDNGCGIAKKDFKLLGQRYATSKYVTLTNFKSIPNTYGFRGQALSSIVDVSKHVKITSRLESSENTWSKLFYGGKEQNFLEVATRPSKGTTVEISGFLYNSKIKSKTINALQELNDIKTFLEQLSLVHINISLTLRDDSTNEIVFKMQKNRDIYQKIKTLFNIDKIDIQELQVEKNEYKSLAYIGKKCDEMTNHHWIFLNNKIVKNSKLSKLVQQNFTKHLKISGKVKKIKSKFSGDKAATKTFIPFYIIFLSCPYYDYDISLTPKHSLLEFKNWKPITTLLEKLIKFYTGNISFKETKVQEKPNISPEVDIREKVREITRKFLGSNSKKVVISQMQNGIKGKLIKRKKKKPKNIVSTKVPLQEASINLTECMNNVMSSIVCENIVTKSKPKHTHKSKLKRPSNKKDSVIFNDIQKNNKIEKSQIVDNYNKNELTEAAKIKPRKTFKPNYEAGTMKKATKRKADPLIKIFENQPEEVKKRCDILAKKAEDTLHNQRMKQTVTINETVNYSNFVRDNKNISIHKRVGEIIIHDIIPLQKNLKKEKPHVNRQDPFKSSRDLLKTILGSQEVQHYSPNIKVRSIHRSKSFPAFNNREEIPGLTYQSHNYDKNRDEVTSHHLNKNAVRIDEFVVETPQSPLNVSFNCNKEHKNNHFISKQSRDNFAVPKTFTLKLHKNKTETSRRGCFNFKNVNMNLFNEEVNVIDTLSNTNRISYTVDEDNNLSVKENHTHFDNMLQNTNHNENQIPYENVIQHDEMRHSVKSSNFDFTYTITSPNVVMNVDDCSFRNFECGTDLRDDNVDINTPFHFENFKGENSYCCKQNQKNIIFVSKSQNSNDSVNCSGNLEPISVCEAVVHSFDTDYENELQLDCNYNEHNDSLQNFSPPVNEQIQNLSLPDHDQDYVGDNIQRLSNILLPPNNDVLAKNNISPENNVVYNQENSILYNLEINSKAINDNNIENNEIDDHDLFTESNYFNEQNIGKDKKSHTNVFNMKNRYRFLPKGMSPIFEHCNSKSICDYNFDKEYFENALYDNFNNDVQTNIEVYEAKVQNTKEVTTKNIEKFNSRLEKDNSTLTFSTKSLKEANVLRQVDHKFITAVLKRDLDLTKYLVLFDQHAVHERVRLEANMLDYFDGNQWKRVNLDDVSLKMAKEEIMYLHNYRDKFSQYGLQWTIVDDNEIKVHSIPLAVLGKNPREVDKVMKTVKNLISEEISNIISQKGCVSVYPKSIMELINNEACRYAIMFGDALSKKECVELLESLSTCKTPFQCAHGRPVMAVVMEFKPEPRDYKINLENVLKFKTKCITNK